MKGKGDFFLIIGVAATLACPVFSQEQQATKYELPVIPLEKDIVSIDLARDIAFSEAQREFGDGVLGKPIIGYALSGSIRAYIFPFKIGDHTFPPDDQIIRDMQEARQLLPKAKAELSKIRGAYLQRRDNVQKTWDVKKSPELKQAEKAVDELRNKSWGIGEYATIVVSARKDLVPILQGSNKLPSYYLWKDAATQKARETLRSSSAYILRFFYGGPLDQMFEFVSPDSQKTWIALFPLREVKPGEISPKKLEVTEEEKKWIKNKWGEVLKRGNKNEK